jgi:hypothetical protein
MHAPFAEELDFVLCFSHFSVPPVLPVLTVRPQPSMALDTPTASVASPVKNRNAWRGVKKQNWKRRREGKCQNNVVNGCRNDWDRL